MTPPDSKITRVRGPVVREQIDRLKGGVSKGKSLVKGTPAKEPRGPSQEAARAFNKKNLGAKGFRTGFPLTNPATARFTVNNITDTGPGFFGRLEEFGGAVKELPLKDYENLLRSVV